jgi:hypothetical protein
MVDDAKLPPIILFFDGSKHWLADGFHRTYAAEAAGQTEILADVRKGHAPGRDALFGRRQRAAQASPDQ